jgi:uncharacterized protein YuzE
MRWTYDLNEDALYVYLDDQPVSGQVEMEDGSVVDVDPQGRAVGVEVLSASAGWDIGAVIQRFNLDVETGKALLVLASSPLLMRTAPTRQVPVDVAGTELVPTTEASNSGNLVRIGQ